MGARSSRPKIAGARAPEVVYFADTSLFARRLARERGNGALRLEEHRFPDGESLIRVPGPVAPRVLLVRSLASPNAKIVEVLLAADALRRSGARHITLVAPYLPYMRQDMVFREGEPVSQEVLGGLLAGAFDATITVEAHLHRIRRLAEVAGPNAVSVSAAPAIRRWLSRHARRAIVVGPDVEATAWTRAIAGAGDFRFAVGRKRRLGDRRVRVELEGLPAADHAVIVDDIASSGATLASAARELRRRGVSRVDAVVAHAIFAPGAEERIRRAGVDRLVSSDTIPHPTSSFSVAEIVASRIGGGK